MISRWYNFHMTTRPDRDTELLNVIMALQESLEKFIQASDQHTESLKDILDAQQSYAKAVDAKVDAQGARVDAVVAAQEAWTGLSNVANEWFNHLDSKVNEVGPKLDGIRNDLAMVRGGHAHAAVLHNAAHIANAVGCTLISEIPKGMLIGMANIAAANGEPDNEVESFRNADLVLFVSDPQGRTGYIAVEASFSVADNDVLRAARNADYLRRFTGLQAWAVVAGVNVLEDAQKRIELGEAHLYSIKRPLLQPD